MRLEQLRLFTAAAECGSISEAARQVHLVQPAFSAQIKALEHDLGVMLLERNARGVTLTPAGRKLYDGALALFRHVDQVRHETLTAGSDLSGEVRIVLASSLAPTLSGRIFVAALAAYPNIRLSILDLLRIASVDLITSRQVDFGLLPNATTLNGAITEPVLLQELYLVGREIPGVVGDTIPFRSLQKYPLVMGGRGNQLRIDLENTAARAGYRINIVSEQESLSVYRSIILNGAYFTVVPYSAYAPEIKAGSLLAARIVEPTVERTSYFAWHEFSELSRPARAVMDLLRVCIAEMIELEQLRGRLLG
ncbi:LysR family transcriptional regulator [Cypionkella sp.]|uniref:LysR family transcriptional regulator n=1 Tax=Cypionkella sp. TaxID=2811411 RepID=UPI0027186918|nr:LysR family transcriptional regulator [Cypionkella sp.]MDO8984436.1 LysR family transcriptional regulator [Cypionkella sp.]MDP2048085.1 LysR family transcriptional regulator [Cypionkella sp.]